MNAGKDPYRFFRIEAHELHEQIAAGLLELERGGEDVPAVVARLLRVVHTLKGAARVVRVVEIAEQAHAIEDQLAPLREQQAAPDAARVEALLALSDAIGQALATLSAAPAEPALGQHQHPAEQALAQSMEVGFKPPPDELDNLLSGITQAHVELSGLALALALARQAGGALRQQDGLSRATEALTRLERLLDGGLHRLQRELDGVREDAEQLRLAPASQLFTALQRAVRDDARAQGKQITLETHGGGVRLESTLLGIVQGALVQMVRNAVAHGIESPERRRAAGKPAQGRLELSIERRGRQVLFSCRDDGAGIDRVALRRVAREKGWPEADGDEAALLRRLLDGGLSTAQRVDAMAGRGVGMDVVREAAERLGAELSLRSEPGWGTTLELLAPMQLAALEALEVEAAGQRLFIPLEAVQQVVPAEGLSEAGLLLDDELLPYASVAAVLGMPVARTGAMGSALVLDAGTAGRAALGVQRLLGSVQVVLRPPPACLPDHSLVSGVVLEAGQHPRLVLDPSGLVRHVQAARSSPRPPRQAAVVAPIVLVVDDSLTTRMLEQSILESAGYTVHLAVSAEQALEAARRHRYALFLVDVEMPGMDGFSFIERTRADPQLSGVPAILLSSRSSAEDKKRGQEVGASAYIVKSEFAQNEFLRQVGELVKMAA